MLGICYGQQTMCAQLGGEVEASDHREFGRAFVEVTGDSALFDGVWKKGEREQVWMSHGDRVTRLPPGFRVGRRQRGRALRHRSPTTRAASTACSSTPRSCTRRTAASCSRNFAHHIAGCSGDWTMAAFREQAIARDPRAGGEGAGDLRPLGRRRFSSVAAVLIHEAIGDQLTCIFVDHGLLRQGEGEEVVELFRDHYNIPLVHRDAERRSSSASSPASPTPSRSARSSAATFIDVFEEEAKKLGGADFLAQGTLYPDVIEMRVASPAAPASPSSRTTMSAACPSA